MFNNSKHAQAGRSIFLSSLTGLANTLAVGVTFIGVPPLYGKTINWVQGYTAANYGYGFEDLTAFAWFILCTLIVFFVSRASISTALMMGGLAVATRFL